MIETVLTKDGADKILGILGPEWAWSKSGPEMFHFFERNPAELRQKGLSYILPPPIIKTLLSYERQSHHTLTNLVQDQHDHIRELQTRLEQATKAGSEEYTRRKELEGTLEELQLLVSRMESQTAAAAEVEPRKPRIGDMVRYYAHSCIYPAVVTVVKSHSVVCLDVCGTCPTSLVINVPHTSCDAYPCWDWLEDEQ